MSQLRALSSSQWWCKRRPWVTASRITQYRMSKLLMNTKAAAAHEAIVNRVN